MKQRIITANAYVLTEVRRLAGDGRTVVAVYPTRELAEQAKVSREETWHHAIVTIEETTLKHADQLDLRLT